MDYHLHGLAFVEHLSYVGTFFAVAFSGYAIPVPEELILIFGGYLAASHISNPFAIIFLGIAGAIFGDNLIYYLSGHGSRFTQKYHKKVENTHAGWYIRHMRKNTFATIFFSRFIIGMRFLNPLVSGLMKVPWDTFVAASALSATIYIPIVVGIGFYFHDQINTVVKVTESVRHILVIGLIIGTVILCCSLLLNLIEDKR